LATRRGPVVEVAVWLCVWLVRMWGVWRVLRVMVRRRWRLCLRCHAVRLTVRNPVWHPRLCRVCRVIGRLGARGWSQRTLIELVRRRALTTICTVNVLRPAVCLWEIRLGSGHGRRRPVVLDIKRLRCG